jgi:hypothetical protein
MKECDLIMKGGVTSGVVYPKAVAEIARSYRLRNIGGTSAGAIAAAIAAAAEYRRQISAGPSSYDGFKAVEGLGQELADDMRQLFQPAPGLAAVFEIFLAMLEKGGRLRKVGKAVLVLARHFPLPTLGPVALGCLLALIAWDWGASIAAILIGILVALVCTGFVLAHLLRRLASHDFGLCPGIRQSGEAPPALTEWLADKIDLIAGNVTNGVPDRPLTVGQLDRHLITVNAMTTDLSSRRPYQLPLRSRHHHFRKSEFDLLFPKRIVDYLIKDRQPVEPAKAGGIDDLYQLPVDDDFPVVLVARLSLSFPGLISAVPLYREDYQLHDQTRPRFRRCLFSDGGVSSNFPVHFFDAFLPSRPTFGIALTEFMPDRHKSRVALADYTRQSTDLPVHDVRSPFQFLWSILMTAKDWQDTLQSLLPGFAERIVEIRLDHKEGGLNLAMERDTVNRLLELGSEAGKKLVAAFDDRYNEHRWLRSLSLAAEMEDSLVHMSRAYFQQPAAGSTTLGYGDLLTTYKPERHERLSPRWRAEVLKPFLEKLATIGAASDPQQAGAGQGPANGPIRQAVQKHGPNIDANLRLTASADRVPRKDSSA